MSLGAIVDFAGATFSVLIVSNFCLLTIKFILENNQQQSLLPLGWMKVQNNT
jgi:hypothetical protein